MSGVLRVDKASDIHTVEGTKAGGRAALLSKARDNQISEFEKARQEISQKNSVGTLDISEKFKAGSSTAQANVVYGIQTLEELRQNNNKFGGGGKATGISDADKEKAQIDSLVAEKLKQERVEKRKKQTSKLSFQVDDEEDEAVDAANDSEKDSNSFGNQKKKLNKNPEVDTSFLPDRERDLALEVEKNRLRQEWLEQQEKVKQELLEVVYSYWDGYGHRRTIRVSKGTTIGKFLESIKGDLSKEFTDLRSVSYDGLIYIKEDLIIPHQYSFYDLIVTKARGKSGPLFDFGVHDDIRLIDDVRVEKSDSHPGKVVQRRWYDQNKHIFPASRWEVYDPKKTYDKYTIHGGEVNDKK